MTTFLQLLAVVASAFGFAAYVLRRDKRDNSPQTQAEDPQQSIYFPDSQSEHDHEHRGAAMSRV